MTKIPSVEERVAELRKIISEKHGGLGLCDYMFENTIVPFLTQALTADRLALLNELRNSALLEEKEYTQFISNKHITNEEVDGHNTIAREIKAYVNNLINPGGVFGDDIHVPTKTALEK